MSCCEKCGTSFTRRSNLTRHIAEGRCKAEKTKSTYTQVTSNNHTSSTVPDTSVQTCSSFPDITKRASNPKMSAFIDAIVNDGEPSTPVSSPEAIVIPPHPKKMPPAKT